MRWAATALFSCLSLWAQASGIEGVTVDTTTGEPLAGVHVRLVSADDSQALAYGAMSDRTGKFSVAIIRPGTYLVSIDRTGFLLKPDKAGGAHFTIRQGEKLTNARIELTRRSILSGRVTDALGDPVSTWIQLSAADTDDPRAFRAGRWETNDRGEFRIVTIPGRYYLMAVRTGAVGPQERPEIGPDGAAILPYSSTYYPSSASKQKATVVEVGAGKEVANLEIRLTREQLLAIRGVVRNLPADASARTQVLSSWESTPGITSRAGTTVTADGKFELNNREPGDYTVQAFVPDKGLFSDQVRVRLDGADANNLDLRLTPAGEIEGSVQVEGAAEALAGKAAIQLLPSNSSGVYIRVEGGAVDPQGTFRITGVGPAKYRLTLQQFPETAYLKKLEADDVVVPTGILDLEHGSRSVHLKLTVSLHGAIIGGRILDDAGQPLSPQMAAAILVPAEGNDAARESSAAIQRDGRYSFRGVRPGKYRIAAIDPFLLRPPGKPDMAAYAKDGEEIEVGEDARINKDLHFRAKEDSRGQPRH